MRIKMSRKYFSVSKKEQRYMSCFICTNREFLQATFEHLPSKIIRHSRRVEAISELLAVQVSAENVPNNLSGDSYKLAVSRGAYYHDIGTILAGNEVEKRPEMSEKVLAGYWNIDPTMPFSRVIFETIRHQFERYDEAENLPLHASIFSIADTFDMFMLTSKSARRNFEAASEYIHKNSGILFHPDAVKCFDNAKLHLLYDDIWTDGREI